MSRELFICSFCGELTTFNKHKEALPGRVFHTFTKCDRCGQRVTVFVSDPDIRALMIKQQSTPPGRKKVKTAEKINHKVAALRKELGL